MDKLLGIYIHIPFCASKCGYCDFYSLAGCDNLMPKYQSALMTHLRESASAFSPYYIDTIYFGGGTPTYYGAKRIAEVLDFFKRTGRLLKSAEVTVEANPDSATPRQLSALLDAGVNRLSLGVQSDNDELLKLLGRRHSVRQAEKAIKSARAAGFKNLSLDLMYGLPGQTKTDWARTITWAIHQNAEHLSCYGLKLEEGTPMLRYADSPLLPTDDDQADMYLYAVETLEKYGYPQYEISNFSRKGFQSQHNLKYWKLRDYMGFGPGAHSCVGMLRYSYIRDLKGYISGVSGEKSIIDEYEQLDLLGRAAEYIMLGMRTVEGISEPEYRSIYPSDFSRIDRLMCEYEKRGWTQQYRGRWRFTSSGFLLSNVLIGGLIEAQTELKMSGNPWMRDAWDLSSADITLPTGNGAFHK